MTYLERYSSGEYELVWNELQALGPRVRREPYYSQARDVATETMRRVRRNCEKVVTRLKAAGYTFGVYPDGSSGYYTEGELVPPSASIQDDLESLEEQAGPLPLSLAAFWQEVGSVDFVGRHPSWPNGLDPLVVYSPEGTLAEMDMMEGDEDEAEIQAILAPDDLHKDNISGGDPYSAALPNESADFLVLNERHNLLFVSYLRLAILRWGGFPGLDGRGISFEPLANLIADLEPF